LFKTLTGHKSDVYRLVFSHNGKLIATASGDNTIKLWNLDGKELKSLASSYSISFMFNPNNKILMVITPSGLQFWNLDGKLIKSVNKSNLLINSVIYSAIFSPDGQRLLVADDYEIKLWKIKDNLQLRKQDIRLNNYYYREKLILNQKGEKVTVIRNNSNIITLKNLHSDSFKTKENDRDRDSTVGLNPDNLLISIQENLVKFWNLDGTSPKLPMIKVSDEITQVDLNHDGKMLAAASPDTTVKLFNQNGDLIKHFDEDINLFEFSPDGKLIVCTGWDNTAKLWKSDGKKIETLQGHKDIIREVVFSPNSQIIATVSRDKTVKLWKPDGTEINTLKGHKDGITEVIFSPDSQLIATVGWDNLVKLWDKEGKPIKTIEGYKDDGHNIEKGQVKFSPDSQMLFVPNDSNNDAQFWGRNGKNILNIKGDKELFDKIFFTPDSQIITSSDVSLNFWDRNGILTNTIPFKFWNLNGILTNTISLADISVLYNLKFSLDGKLIIIQVIFQRNRGLIFFKSDGTIIKNLKAQCYDISCVRFSADNQTIAKIEETSVKLWNQTGEEITTELIKSNAEILLITINNISNPDTPIFDRIASVDKDNIINLWDSKGKKIATLKEHKKEITQINFSPDGKTFVSVDKNKIVKFWNSSNGKLIKIFKGHEHRVSNITINPDNQSIAVFG